jgi:hypothetical protein
MASANREASLASIEPKTSGYITDRQPGPDQAVEILCRDQFGGYGLPFLCILQDGSWTKAETGNTLAVEVLGWRVSKKMRFSRKLPGASVTTTTQA